MPHRLLLLPLLLADLPLPDWSEELVVSTWTSTDEAINAACRWPGPAGLGAPLTCDLPRLDQAIARAEQFEREVRPDGRLRYLIALAHRHAGRLDRAEQLLEQAATLSPDRPEIHADLGELHLARQAWDLAARDFQSVTRLNPGGPRAWYGWLQLAQVEAHRHDPDAFEAALRAAIDHDLPLELLAAQPAWRTFYADPTLRPIIDRMVGLRADPRVLESLRAP